MRRVALVHDWLTVYTGSERVFEQILMLYPESDVYSLIDYVPNDQREFLQDKEVQTSFLQHFPFVKQKYRQYLGLMPFAIEQFDLTNYDLVISSSHAVAKGVITGPDQLHISYIYSPIRYAWDMQYSYLNESGLNKGPKSWLARALLHYIRLWDLRTINSIDAIATLSKYISRRIRKLYRRDATVIYPPVDVSLFPLCEQKEDYYLVVSRLVQYKRVALIVEAFTGMPDRKLVVIGDGPELKRINKMAAPNIEILGFQSQEVVLDYMQRARAFVFAAQEDFGIAPLEAQSCGTPVIAYGVGGATETIKGMDDPHPTGIFFKEQSIQGLQAAVKQFDHKAHLLSPHHCRENAKRFTPERFRQEFSAFVENQWESFSKHTY